jgi:mRNA interferase RelE/StbE
VYRLRLLDEAAREFSRLDKPIALRIFKRLQWLAENLDKVKPQPLSGTLSDFYKFRVGDYRVIYEIARDEGVLLIRAIGHRREIYKS